MKSPQRTCYIHIGTHKTGTTSIQVFLASNREHFFANGVFWPSAGSDGDAGVASHHELARELNGSAAFRPDRGGLEAVAAELSNSGARVACLSSEDLTFLWDKPASLVRLRDTIRSAGFVPRVIVYLRPQAPYCTAVYAENVRHGYREPFAHYLNDVLERGHYVWDGGLGPPFDYTRLLEPFARVFGRDALIARRYRTAVDDNHLLFAFARLLLPNVDTAALTTPVTRQNGSPDFASVLTSLGVAHAVSERLRFCPLDIAQLTLLGLRFAPSNAAAAASYGVLVPPFELLDVALALPVRRTAAKIQALMAARRALDSSDRNGVLRPARDASS